MSKKNKKQFTSNVTGEQWQKELLRTWKRVINQVGVIIEDEVHEGKHGTTLVLKSGTKVIVDDIRGRIKPQYRVRDESGKIWFVGAQNIDFSSQEDNIEENLSENSDPTPIYRGGVRVDGTAEEELALPKRYAMPKSTDEEIKELKERKKNG